MNASREETAQGGAEQRVTVRLPRVQAETMVAHARSGAPEEVCGLVAQDQAGQLVAVLPVPNSATNRIITYHMEPLAQHRAFMEMERQGWELAGIYHSHPATQAYPSQTDQALAFDPFDDQPLFPDALYFIVSLADPQRPTIRAFLLPDPTTIEEVTVRLADDK